MNRSHLIVLLIRYIALVTFGSHVSFMNRSHLIALLIRYIALVNFWLSRVQLFHTPFILPRL